MPSFEYLVLNNSGQKQRGFVEADSERQARQQLRDQQLTPVRIKQSETRQGRSRQLLQRRIPGSELSLFTRHLSALIASSVPLEEALQACANQTGHRQLKAVILNLRSRVMEGHSLSYALEEQQQFFPPIYRALVSAGEQSGDLAQVLVRLAEHTEKSQKLHNQVVQASVYPIVLTLVAVGVVALLMVYVVPKVVEQFAHVGQDLPLLTRIMISISDFISQYGLVCVGLGVATLLVLRSLFKAPNRRLWLHRRMLSMPLMKGLIIRMDSARLLSTLSIMTSSGAPLLEALETSKATVSNLFIRRQVEQAASQVREGRSLSKTLGESGIFPPIAIYMIANGEQSGTLDRSLQQAADQQEEELNSFIAIATSLMEPLLIVIFGAIVLSIVLAILLPILQLNNLTQF